MDESSWQVGCVNVTMSVLLIISRISDHLGPGAPEPESSPLTALAPDTLQIQSRVQSLRGTGLFSTSSQQTKQTISEKVERTMIPTLEIPHHPAQRRRSLPRLPDIPCPQQPSHRVQSKDEMKIVHGVYHDQYNIFN